MSRTSSTWKNPGCVPQSSPPSRYSVSLSPYLSPRDKGRVYASGIMPNLQVGEGVGGGGIGIRKDGGTHVCRTHAYFFRYTFNMQFDSLWYQQHISAQSKLLMIGYQHNVGNSSNLYLSQFYVCIYLLIIHFHFFIYTSINIYPLPQNLWKQIFFSRTCNMNK